MPTPIAKTIFLIDGLGAVTTALLLLTVLRVYEKYFGMPADILVLLSTIAFIFALYSFTCYLFIDKTSPRFLLPIIIANLTYCFLTLGLIVYNYDRLTYLGIAYFIVEIVIVYGLICFEYKIFKKARH